MVHLCAQDLILTDKSSISFTYGPCMRTAKRPSGDAGRAGGGDAMSALLASYYGLASDDDGPIKTEDEIDCAEFSSEAYVRKMLQREVRI